MYNKLCRPSQDSIPSRNRTITFSYDYEYFSICQVQSSNTSILLSLLKYISRRRHNMQASGSSSMFVFTFTFRLLCIICCIIAVTSYKISYRPSIGEDRNERAVTEWRFRRNFLLRHPYLVPVHPENLMENVEKNDYGQFDETKSHEKQFIIPQLARLRSERKK
ncbi:unnamed protein product [Rotaria socialis]|uniref:Uncharacterized protein n=1 Tax=Rotaria socialis TaxID=392032 RepID=A0A818EM63_9BILA|nr:unnamed protein product [Rotaria socialis]CAF3461088.1 unnamed protein product [Rotaria socialis]CAF3678315.1 unnamed protein product [Rotaria socialis]CAF3706398.1 unnamed protein product [Rotaria socialis]CAF4179498.1 unnamed protein product [Rotaria socialis]